MALMLIIARYLAIVLLVGAVILIIGRWRYPRKRRELDSSVPGKASGLQEKQPSFWQAAWRMHKEAVARDRLRATDLRGIRGKQVLVVDPDEKSGRVLVWRLEQLGCTVMKARTGSQALKLLRDGDSTGSGRRDRRVEAVIADALLPDVSAADFCDALAEWDLVIVLIGVLKAQRQELAGLGQSVGCLAKPYDPDDAAAMAGRMLTRRAKVGTIEG